MSVDVAKHTTRLERPNRARQLLISLPESVQQTDHIAEQMEEGVLIDFFRSLSLPIASHIRRNRVESGICKSMQLMAPRIP